MIGTKLCILGENNTGRSILLSANFDHLVKVLSAKLLHCKVTVLTFWVNKFLGGDIFKTMQILSLLNFAL